LLRIFESKWAIEMASKLLDLFFTFGALKILQNGIGREFVNSVNREFKDMSDMFQF
jgi:hypothetical protein